MIRHIAGVCCIAKTAFRRGSRWLLAAAAVLVLQAASAAALPGQAISDAGAQILPRAALPLLRVALCPDGRPCPDDETPYGAPRHYPPGWKREPPPYPPQEHEDCIEDTHAARLYPIRTPPAPHYGDPMLEEPCGIRCWYRRLRSGYCGRGCDYYRYRMTAFPEGRLGRHPRRVACRVDR